MLDSLPLGKPTSPPTMTYPRRLLVEPFLQLRLQASIRRVPSCTVPVGVGAGVKPDGGWRLPL